MRALPGKAFFTGFFLLISSAASVNAQQASSIWEAEMPFGPAAVRLRLELHESADGLRGQIVNVSDDEAAFPIDRLVIDGPSVRLQSCTLSFNPFQPVMGATFQGVLSEDGSVIRGTLAQIGARFPVEFRRNQSLPRQHNDTLRDQMPDTAERVLQCSHPARSAAEQVLEAMPEIIGRGDRDEYRAFIAQRFGQPALAAGIETWVDRFSAFHHASHGFELREIQDAGGSWETGLLRNRLTGDWISLSVIVDVESPYGVVGLTFTPVMSPEPALPRPSTRQIERELRAYVERLADGDVFSGAVLLAREGKIVFEGAYGMADKNFGVPNTIDTKFNIGSMNKMFTAVGIMQLVESGRLSLDDPLSRFLPEFPDAVSAHQITIEHLLTHASGITSDFTRPDPAVPSRLYRTVDDFMGLIVDKPLDFEPGTQHQYSNGGFVVAGKVIEAVTEDDYYDYIREHIYEPAGMPNSDHYSLDEVTPKLAIGYQREYTDQGPVYLNNTYAGGNPRGGVRGSPAGGGYSTVEDLLNFVNALLGNKLLDSDSVELMLTEQARVVVFGRCCDSFGYGFAVNSQSSRVGHSGGTIGAYANLDIFLDSGWSAIVLSNYGEGNVPAYPSVIGKIRELVNGGFGGPG